MTKTSAGVSLASLNARAACEDAYEFEYIGPDGNPTGLWFSVIGTHSDTITKAGLDAEDARRRKDMVRAAKNAKARPENMDLEPSAEELERGIRGIAKRLVGWRGPQETDGLKPDEAERFEGITDPWSEDNALLLVRTNPHIAASVMEKSNDLGNWMGKSPKS